jgi:hypothetical protein
VSDQHAIMNSKCHDQWCVCVLFITAVYPHYNAVRGGKRIVEDLCYERRRAEDFG